MYCICTANRIDNIIGMLLCLRLITIIAIFILISLQVESLPTIIKVGGLFNVNEEEQELAFRFAIERINADESLLPKTTLVAQVERVENADSFHTQKKVCGLLRNEVVAIFGPHDGISSMQVQSICETFEIPHIETRLDFETHRTDLSLSLFPRPSILCNVYKDLIKAWDWKSFAIIYEQNDGIIHFKDFFLKSRNESWNIKLFQLMPDRPYRDIFWKVKETNEMNIILDVRKEIIPEVLAQAQQVGLITEFHKYLFTTLDLHTLDLEDFRHSLTNLTSLRIVDENNQELRNLYNEWHVYASRLRRRNSAIAPDYLQAESALIYDAMKVLAKALQELYQFEVQPIICESGQPWLHGSSIINYMRQISFEGITRFVKFDDSGFRSGITFDIISITPHGFDITGKWFSGKINKSEKWAKHYSNTRFENEVIRITTALSDPFTMTKNHTKDLKGNDRYEGYVVDLVNELAKELNVRVEINIVKDGAYGSYNNDTKQWVGMIGEVIKGEADLAVADLAINSDREKVVDFTYPFMATGISILYKRPTTKETSLWSFLSPFSTVVWIYMLGTFFGVSVILFFVGRFTPYEWTNPHPCRQNDKVLENILNMRNSFWCTIGSLMQQGSDVAPKAMSTRVIVAIWYFFTLIIISSYTANLAAFLTVEKIPFPFENAEGLAAQTKIKYGCAANGATHKFFKSSNIPTYKVMAQFMEKNPDVLKKNSAAGKTAVEAADGKYAFFMEAALIEYSTERFCNLTQVGGLLDNKGYGIATQKGSKFRTPLSQAILKLQETGVLQSLKDRWWKQKGGGQCVSKPSNTLTELGLRNLGGVFVVLLGGSVLAILLAICEFIYKTRKSNKYSNTFSDELIEDFKFALSCQTSSKPVKRKSEKSLNTSKSFTGSKTGSSPRLESQFSTYY